MGRYTYRGNNRGSRRIKTPVIISIALMILLCSCNSNTVDNNANQDNMVTNTIDNINNENRISKDTIDKIYTDTLKQVILETYTEDKEDNINDNTLDVEKNGTNDESSDIPEEVQGEIPEETLGDTSEEIENSHINQQLSSNIESDIQNIINKTISESEYYDGITRYQCAALVYDILNIQGKIPDLTGYQLSYIDDIPERHIIPICVLDKLGINYGEQFSGYNTISIDELQNIFNKLAVYIKNYKEDTNTTNNNENKDKENIQIEQSEYNDTLFGESVAVFKYPTTSNEIDANIDAIIPVDMDSGSTVSKYNSYEPVYAQYINLHESIINADDIGGILNGETNSAEIMGVSKVNAIHLSISDSVTSSNGTVYESSLFEVGNMPIFTKNYGCIGLKNNKVITKLDCEISPDGTNILIIPTGIDIDTIGFIVDKLTFENQSTENSQITKVLVLAEIA